MLNLFANITPIYLLYLFYGVVFLFLGVSIAAKDMKGSDLKLADRLWLLGMFGFLHGAHEWLKLGPLIEGKNLLHLLVPLAYIHTNGGPTAYGLGDTEVGIKYRFIPENETTPQVGTFPILRLPTGDSDRGLGGGHVSTFLPLWVQKSWGPWTTYGGGGYWINPREGNMDYWQLGWLAERKITESLTIGAEIFYFGKDTEDGRNRTGYNMGGILDLSEDHHILFSAGRDIAGDNRLSAYLGYQWTFGAHAEGKSSE